jgi:predicted phosphodiesterase
MPQGITNPRGEAIRLTKKSLENLQVHFAEAIESIRQETLKNYKIDGKAFKPVHGKRSVNLCVSDTHFGEKHIEDDVLKYALITSRNRTDAAFVRAEEVYLLTPEVNEINVWLLGDNVDGDGTVYPGQKHNLDDVVGTQIVAFAESVYYNVFKLSNRYPKVKINIYGIAGNHGTSKSQMFVFHSVADSYDTTCYKMIESMINKDKALYKKLLNVDIKYSTTSKVLNAKVKGWTFVATHIMPNNLSSASAVRKAFSYIMSKKADIILTGHFHETAMLTVGKAKVIRIGTMVGHNDYAEELGIPENSPEQGIIVTSEAMPMESFYPVIFSEKQAA